MSAGIICCEKRTVFRERGSRKLEAMRFEEQIMSKEKYPSIMRPLERLSLTFTANDKRQTANGKNKTFSFCRQLSVQ